MEERSSDQFLAVVDVACLGHAVQALRLEVSGERADFSSVRPVPLKYSMVAVVDREKAIVAPYSGAMLPMVGAIGNGEAGRAFAEKLDEFAHHFLRRSISVTVSTKSVAVTPSRSFPLRLTRPHRRQKIDRLSQHSGFASMPPTPQATTPTPLIHGVCESVPTSVSDSRRRLFMNTAREVFEVYLVHDAHARRTTLNVRRPACPTS